MPRATRSAKSPRTASAAGVRAEPVAVVVEATTDPTKFGSIRVCLTIADKIP